MEGVEERCYGERQSVGDQGLTILCILVCVTLRLMKRTTISLPDDLEAALSRYRREREAHAPVSALAQTAIREFLARRGYATASGAPSFHLTAWSAGSGLNDVSVEHDRYFAESVERD